MIGLREGAEHTFSHVYANYLLIFFPYFKLLKFLVHFRPKSCAVEKEKSQRPLLPQENAVNVGVKARKRDKLPKLSVQQSDGAKYGKRYSHRNKDVINSLERELKDKLNAENSLQKHDVELDLRKNDQESLNPNQRGDLAPDWPGKTG